MNRPPDLGPAGLALWESLTSDYEFRADELRVLEDACREVDLIERMREEADKLPLMVQGSQGQPVASPLVQELRQHRALLARLLGSLRISDVDDESGPDMSEFARYAARKRWGR